MLSSMCVYFDIFSLVLVDMCYALCQNCARASSSYSLLKNIFSFLLCSFIGVPYLSDEPLFLQTKKACRVSKINEQLPINCALYRQVISLESYEAGTDCTRIVAVIP